MALPSKARRSFVIQAMSAVAGAWVVVTGGAAGAWLVAGCRDPSPTPAYGGPPPQPEAIHEPIPSATLADSPDSATPTASAAASASASASTSASTDSPPPVPKYGGPPPPVRPVAKYGGPPAKPKYGGSPRKYGGPGDPNDLF